LLAPLRPSDRRKFIELLTQLVDVNNVYSRAPLDNELLDGLTARRKLAAGDEGKKRSAAK
jgi:hypothetical protein